MSRERPKTFEDLARELMVCESLETKLAMSLLVAKARQVAKQQAADRAKEVVDHKRGLRLVVVEDN